MNDTPSGHCVRESDGFHQHVYRAQVPHAGGTLRWATIVRDDLHSWTAEHMAEHPDAPRVCAHLRQYPGPWIPLGEFETVEDAWTGLRAVGDIPVITCHQDAEEA